MALKAYIVYPGDNPHDEGCILVFTENRHKARLRGALQGPWCVPYMEMNARRAKDFDKQAKGNVTYHVETNDELDEPFFTNGEAL